MITTRYHREDITMTNSTSTPAAPLTLEPPKCCPACGCTEYDNNEKDFFAFECGAEGILGHAGWRVDGHECTRAFAAAVGLRAERDAALARADRMKTNGEELSKIIGSQQVEVNFLQARAEKAEAERDGVMARNQYMADELILIRDILRGAEIEIDDEDSVANGVSVLASCDKEEIKRADLWYGEYMTKSELLESTEAELTAARARLAELQAVCDAAIKYSAAHHFVFGPNYKFYCVDKQADDEFDAALDALAALASGAESETK